MENLKEVLELKVVLRGDVRRNLVRERGGERVRRERVREERVKREEARNVENIK
tara:strand:- start:122 stop:283 length:162 start_codon:yes stop_codon:yes gene_type:complete